MKDFSQIDWGALFKKYSNPQAIKDFDAFLDALPLNVGYNALIAAGMAWVIAGCAVFFAALETDKVSQLRAELAKVEALKPPIPVIKYTAVAPTPLQELQEKIMATYKGINFVGGPSDLKVSAGDTDYFPQFLAAINTIQNGGRDWRVSLKSLCVGRDCTGSSLSASLKVEYARVMDPPRKTE